MKTTKKKEPNALGCQAGGIGAIALVIYFIIFLFKRDLPFWPLGICIALMLIGMIAMQINNNNDQKTRFKKQGIDPKKFLFAGKYLSGHTKIDKPQENCSLYVKDEFVKIYTLNKSTLTKAFLANIEKDKIQKITLEDKSSIQKRVGLKRMLAIGIFAFAVKKKSKVELAYIVIDWNEGRFKHETVFEFEGKGSIEKANFLRNKLINKIS